MSYSLRNQYGGIASNYASGKDADANYIEESLKIQDNIQAIQSCIMTISKLYLLPATSAEMADNSDKEYREKLQTAKDLSSYTHRMLIEFGGINRGNAAERTQRHLMHQKLTQNFQDVLFTLEDAAKSALIRGKTHRGMWQSASAAEVKEGVSPTSQRKEENALGQYSLLRDSNGLKLSSEYSDETRLSMDSHLEGDAEHQALLQLSKNLQSTIEMDIMMQRSDGISRIHRDIEGIHQIYQEMALHVENQGDAIENIEVNARDAYEHTQDTSREVLITRNRQHSAHKRLIIWVFSISLICCAIIFLVIRRQH